jgi:hypothetical protein
MNAFLWGFLACLATEAAIWAVYKIGLANIIAWVKAKFTKTEQK